MEVSFNTDQRPRACCFESDASILGWSLLTAANDGKIYKFERKGRWNVNDIERSSWQLHDEAIKCLDYCNEQKLLITGGLGGTVRCSTLPGTDVEATVHSEVNIDSRPNSVYFVPGEPSKALVSVREGWMAYIDLGDGRMVTLPASRPHRNNPIVQALPISPHLVATASTDCTAKIVDSRDPFNPALICRCPGWVYCVSTHADTPMVQTGCRNRVTQFWDKRSPNQLCSEFIHNGGVPACSLSRDSSIAVSGSSDGSVKVIRDTVREVEVIRGPEMAVSDLALSTNRQILAIAYYNCRVKVVDLAHRERRHAARFSYWTKTPDVFQDTIVDFLY